MNFIDPEHLQGVMNGLNSSSNSSRQILQALSDSKAPYFKLSFKPPTGFFLMPGLNLVSKISEKLLHK